MDNKKFGGLSFEDLDRAASLDPVPAKPAAPAATPVPVKPAAPVQPPVSAKPAAPVRPTTPSKPVGPSSAKDKPIESPGFRRHKYGCIGAMIVGLLLVIIGIINYANTLSARGNVWGPMFFVLFAASVFSVGVSGLLLTKIMDPTGQTKGTLKENITIVRTTIGLSLILSDILFVIICFTILKVVR